MNVVRLVVWGAEGPVYREAVRPEGLRLGRAPVNDLVFADPSVSAHHAVVTPDVGGVLVEDLRSRNGTTVRGEPVVGRALARPGDQIVLGGVIVLAVEVGEGPSPGRAWAIDVGGGVQVPIRGDRARIGGGSADQVVVAGLPPGAARLVVHQDEVRLVTDDDDVALVPDQPFQVGGATLALVQVDADVGATEPRPSVWVYRLQASVSPARAVLQDSGSGRTYRSDTELRALLLWVLGRAWLDDPADEAVRGWTTDEAVAVALWGREGLMSDPARLRVLLSRLRRDLERAGLDGTCIEKRGRQIRIRLSEAEVT